MRLARPLSSAMRRIADASGVRLELDAGALPLADGVAAVARALGRPGEELAATGGEDFELLACVPPGRAAEAEAIGITWVGEVAAGPAELTWRGAPSGARDWHGFEH